MWNLPASLTCKYVCWHAVLADSGPAVRLTWMNDTDCFIILWVGDLQVFSYGICNKTLVKDLLST